MFRCRYIGVVKESLSELNIILELLLFKVIRVGVSCVSCRFFFLILTSYLHVGCSESTPSAVVYCTEVFKYLPLTLK